MRVAVSHDNSMVATVGGGRPPPLCGDPVSHLFDEASPRTHAAVRCRPDLRAVCRCQLSPHSHSPAEPVPHWSVDDYVNKVAPWFRLLCERLPANLLQA